MKFRLKFKLPFSGGAPACAESDVSHLPGLRVGPFHEGVGVLVTNFDEEEEDEEEDEEQ